MANRYANLPGASKIKDTYDRINQGFDLVEQDVDQLRADLDQEIADREAAVEYVDQRVDNIIVGGGPDKDPELVDIRTVDPSYTPQRTINVAGDLTRDMQAQFAAHLAKTADDDVHGLAFKGVLFELSASQSIAGGELQKLIWGDKIYEVGINFTATDGDIIIPPEVSIVRVITNIRWSNNPQFDSGNIDIEAEIRGSSSIQRAYDCRRGVRSATINLSSVVRRSDSTQLSVFVRHTATDPINVIKDSRTFLYIEVVQ